MKTEFANRNETRVEPQGGWSRRQFIQISSAVAGGATVLGTGAAAIGVPTGQHAPDPQVGGIKIGSDSST